MRKISILLVLIFVLMAVSVSAQDEMMDLSFMGHSECETDLTGEVLTIYHIGDLSGPYAAITLPLLAGIEDAINFYNEEGILCGATLDQMYEDTGNDQSITQSAYDRFSTLDPKPTAMILYSSDDSELLRNQLAEDEIPVLLAGGSVTGVFGEDASEPGWIFATNPLYVDQLGMFCDYVAANPEMFPDPSIGYLSWEGAFGHSGDTDEVWGYCEAAGVAHAGSEFFLPTSQDIGNQAQNLVDNGATILYTNTLASGPVLVANTVNTLGLDVHVAGVNWVMDTSSVGLLGQAAFGEDGLPITNGLLGSMPFSWWTETSHPGVQLITQLADKGERSPFSRNVAYILGFASIDVIVEMYIQAANDGVAFADIDGAVVKSYLENMEFAPLGLTDLDYRDGNRDAPMNRIGMMAYLGEDGMTPAGADMAPMVVTLGDRNFLVPILIPLTDFEATPDLKPGGADVVGE